MDNGGRIVAHYSLSFPDPARRAGLLRQLDISLTTLRATNPDLEVTAFCHGAVPDELHQLAALRDVDVVPRPDPVTRLVDELGPIGHVLGRFGPVHKFLNFASLSARGGAASLYLDADTVVFGDLTRLLEADGNVVAREEVGSLRCPFGADPAYLDEVALRATCAAVGIRPAPAFNTGVVLLRDFPWDRGPRIERRYLTWLVRFALWMADHPADPRRPEYADVFDLHRLRDLLAGRTGHRLRALAAPYPSVNRWLTEEAAAWVALGAETDLTFGRFDSRLVAQGGEPLDGPLPSVLWHYFSSNQGGMAERLGLVGAVPRT